MKSSIKLNDIVGSVLKSLQEQCEVVGEIVIPGDIFFSKYYRPKPPFDRNWNMHARLIEKDVYFR